MPGSGDDVLVVKDMATLKALADPLRRSILDILDTARTVKELAAELDRPADRLYYHLDLLEHRGLVRAIEERGRERRYVAAAKSITVDPAITMPPAIATDLVSGTLTQLQTEYVTAIARTKGRGRPRRVLLSVRHVLLTEAERAELMDHLREIAERYPDARHRDATDAEHEGDTEARTPFGVVTGMWPVTEEGP